MVALVFVCLFLAGCAQGPAEKATETTPRVATGVVLPKVVCDEAVVLTFLPKAEIRTALAVPGNVALMSSGDFLGRTGLAPQAPPSGTPGDDLGVIASGNMACDDGSLYHAIVTPIESLHHANITMVDHSTVEFYSDARALALLGPRMGWFSSVGVAALNLTGSTHTFVDSSTGKSSTIEVVVDGLPALSATLEGGEADPSFAFPIRAWLHLPDGSAATYDLERNPVSLYNAFITDCATSGYAEDAFGQCDPPTVGAIQSGFDERVNLQTYPSVPFADLA